MAESHDLINKLPVDCMKHIFSFIELSQDHRSCAAVCRKWLKLQVKLIISKVRDDSDLTLPLFRRLEGRSANDTVLATLAVGTYPYYNLTSLYLREVSPIGITDDGLKTIAQVSPYLTFLTLHDCQSVGNEAMTSVAKHCRQLKKLELINSLVDDDGIIPVAESCLDLYTLSLEHCPCISNKSLMAFANKSLNLECVILIDCILIGDSGVFSLISGHPELVRIRLISMEVGDVVLDAIRKHGSTLEVFCLEKASYHGDSCYSLIEAAEKLESPSSSPFASFTRRSLSRLTKVDLESRSSLNDEMLVELSKMAKLVKTFKLKKCWGFTHGGIFEAAKNWSQRLEVISLKQCIIVVKQEMKQEQASHNFPSLTTIKLVNCEGVDDGFLSWFGLACKQVKHISLVALASITVHGLQAILMHTSGLQLKRLYLSGCTGIDDLGFRSTFLSSGVRVEFSNLEGSLSLSNHNLKLIAERCGRLDVSDAPCCRINDDGLFYLVMSCGETRAVLSLPWCAGITQKSVRYVETMCFVLGYRDRWDCRKLSRMDFDSIHNHLKLCAGIFN